MRPPDPAGTGASSVEGGSELLRAAAALVYVSDLEAPAPDPDDVHHLSAVLRLRQGELVIASDGVGGWRGCRVRAPGPGAAGSTGPAGGGTGGGSDARDGRSRHGRHRSPAIVLEPDTEVTQVPRVGPEITVGASLAKGDRTEWAVTKLSELGVDRIMPLICERTAAGAPRAGRLQRIAREASMQARRLWLPEIYDPVTFAEALAILQISAAAAGSPRPASFPGCIAIAEPGGAPPSLATPVVLVGPEGGWSPAELALGLPQVCLGPTILRIETAAVVAGTLLTALRSGTVATTGR
ncbi:MAG: 16S rRNA (uracil(1498)-N(3))-methyltransferase [Acidimicrobiales bacterium]|jgi:16S rRNA (uracil1498-N3)-methyltransferase